MTNKMTNRTALTSALEFIPNVAENEELRAKLNAMIDALDKKNASPRKLTERQNENAGLKVAILSGMEVGRGYTVSELMTAIPELAKIEGLSNQRVSAIANQMVDEKTLEKYSEKRRTYFRVVTAE